MKIPEEGHFYPIVDIQRFACDDGHHTEYVCYNCLKSFDRASTLEKHKIDCYEFHKVPEIVPKRPIFFHDYRVLRDVPAKIGFDTEAFNRILSKLEPHIVLCLPKKKNIQGVQRVYYCALILDTKPEYVQYIPEGLFQVSLSTGGGSMFIGSDCVVKFLELLKKLDDTFFTTIAKLKGYEMAPLTIEDKEKHQEGNICGICGRESFCADNSCMECWNCFFLGGKVHHHNHLINGYNYICPAHYKCNINNRKDKFVIPVFALNNFGYDFEHILEGMGNCSIDWKLT